MCLRIKDGSIFVADSHYNEKNQEFLIFLEKLLSKKINTTQLFLMGDIFDFMSGESRYFIKRNRKLIDILNSLSKHIQIYYFEGNHDYNLQILFPNIKVFKREQQPVIANYKKKSVALSHGDNFTPWHYNLYCIVIRNSILLKFLNMIDFNNFISKKIYYSLLKKNICKKNQNFEELVKKRVKHYRSDIIIEGHFHQGKSFEIKNQLYINIPSLCCNKKYTVLNDKFIGISL